MAELTVDMTYGTALLEAARDAGKEKEILDEGFEILKIIRKEPEFKKFIEYPGIASEDKKDVVNKAFSGSICRELLNFLYILIDKRRTASLEGIMKEYRNLYEREEGVSYGTVYSVEQLSNKQLKKIEEQTSKLLREKVKLRNKLDPKLMAGVKVMIEGKIIDASYQRKLEDMAHQLQQS